MKALDNHFNELREGEIRNPDENLPGHKRKHRGVPAGPSEAECSRHVLVSLWPNLVSLKSHFYLPVT